MKSGANLDSFERFAVSCSPSFRWRIQWTSSGKYALLFAATILAARKLHEIGDKKCPAREYAIADAIEKAGAILREFDERCSNS